MSWRRSSVTSGPASPARSAASTIWAKRQIGSPTRSAAMKADIALHAKPPRQFDRGQGRVQKIAALGRFRHPAPGVKVERMSEGGKFVTLLRRGPKAEAGQNSVASGDCAATSARTSTLPNHSRARSRLFIGFAKSLVFVANMLDLYATLYQFQICKAGLKRAGTGREGIGCSPILISRTSGFLFALPRKTA